CVNSRGRNRPAPRRPPATAGSARMPRTRTEWFRGGA
ncbi:MAG: hypothetical protein AVDCRST_MAG19-2722, partial [uncultured Thermomicrobiales bacterium]